MEINLRDYQTHVIDKARSAYAQHRAPLLVLPTGAGKTIIFCNIVRRVVAKGKTVVILVHRQELLRQTSEKLQQIETWHGLIAPGHTMTGDPVQVASVQTLARRLDHVPAPDLIVVDECHHAGAKTWRDIITRWDSARLLGVTATPCRLDGKGLGIESGGFFDVMIEGPTIQDLIARGYLSQPIVYSPPTDLDLDGVHISNGDFVQKELGARVDKPTITGSAIDHYRKLCPDAPAICFCASVDHAEHVAAQFQAAGIASCSLTGNMTDGIRKARISGLASGQIKVLTSCDIISEGTDIPVVSAAILLRPTASLGLYLQQVGRALRPFPGKTHATILDHVGNCLRHGMPDEVREWSLDGVKNRKKKDAGLKVCPMCLRPCKKNLSKCPTEGCDYRWTDAPVAPGAGREPEQRDGQLVRVTPEMLAKKKARMAIGMARTKEDLERIATERGYHYAWVDRMWAIKQERARKPETRYDESYLEYAARSSRSVYA